MELSATSSAAVVLPQLLTWSAENDWPYPVAPEGCDSLKILPHIPYIDDDRPLTQDDYLAYKETIFDKLERMGLENLRRHIVVEHVFPPREVRFVRVSTQGCHGLTFPSFSRLTEVMVFGP